MNSYHLIAPRADLIEERRPINYFDRRQGTELVLRRIEELLKRKCFYCHNCKHCTKFQTYKKEFTRNGFWTFNKHIQFWDIFDPDYHSKKANFEIRPIRYPNFQGV